MGCVFAVDERTAVIAIVIIGISYTRRVNLHSGDKAANVKFWVRFSAFFFCDLLIQLVLCVYQTLCAYHTFFFLPRLWFSFWSVVLQFVLFCSKYLSDVSVQSYHTFSVSVTSVHQINFTTMCNRSLVALSVRHWAVTTQSLSTVFELVMQDLQILIS